ncbi:hypothetical protein EZS27_037960 [termite gut metagenome]|uniref:ISXO2-like transposase domain-containing protein n=1 Tax=termite gut metagenome TaxID=433724 RepID=A0A5J4PPV1_9ZZZZ
MGKGDEQYALSGVIELDEGFFSTETNNDEKQKPLKRGRGSQKRSKVSLTPMRTSLLTTQQSKLLFSQLVQAIS